MKQDAIPDIYSQLDYNINPDDIYDSICRTVNPDGTKQRDSHICSNPLLANETEWLIDGKGCYLSSTAMVFGYFKSSITPPGLNDFLKGQNQGYVGEGKVNPFVAVQSPRNHNVNVTAKGAGTKGNLSQDVCSKGPQLMGVKCVTNKKGQQKATHWVLAYGQDQNKTTWLIVDPNGGKKITLASKYTGGFCETRLYQGPEFTFTDSRGITISFHSPGELLLTDPNGLRFGFDPIANQSYIDIPNAFYDDVDLQDDDTELPGDSTDTLKSLGVPAPVAGDYNLTITGTGVGTYTMDIMGMDASGGSSVSTFASVPLAVNLVQQMIIHYDPTPGAQMSVAGAFDGGGNHFLSFASPVRQATLVPAGQNNFPVLIFYGSTITPASFTASLNGQDLSSTFHPVAGTFETVNVPLPNGLSSLNFQVSGTTAGGQIATDNDTLQFDMGGSAPNAPSGLTAAAITDQQINLAWTASSSTGVTYSVFRSTTSGFTPIAANQIASGLTGTTFADTGLSASTTYFYVVEAVDPFASSAASNQASTTTLTPGSCSGIASTISANFNGTAIAAGDSVWFSSVGKVSGQRSSPVTIFIRKATITFTANGTNFNVAVPDANVTFDPNATTATTTFDSSASVWRTVVPSSGLAGNVFLDGAELMLPNGLPGGVKNVSWTATFSSDTPGVTLNWQWAAAAYTSLGVNCTGNGPNFNDLGVKPVDDNKASQYQNSDHAGTPEEYKAFVVGGATGGGGSNFTGSYSATKSVTSALVNSCGTNAQPPSCQ